MEHPSQVSMQTYHDVNSAQFYWLLEDIRQFSIIFEYSNSRLQNTIKTSMSQTVYVLVQKETTKYTWLLIAQMLERETEPVTQADWLTL
jgi:hypothetical protein